MIEACTDRPAVVTPMVHDLEQSAAGPASGDDGETPLPTAAWTIRLRGENDGAALHRSCQGMFCANCIADFNGWRILRDVRFRTR